MGRFRDPRVKPPFGAELDLNHPDCDGLVLAALLAEEWTGSDDGTGFTAGYTIDQSKFRNRALLLNTTGPQIEGSPYGVARGWVRGLNSQVIAFPNRAEYEIDGVNRTTLSMEALVAPHNTNGASGVGMICAFGDGGLDSSVTNQGYSMGYVGSTSRIFARIGTTAVNTPSGALTCDDRTLSHVVVTYDGANIRRYVNGRLIGVTAKAGYTTNNVNGSDFGIGNTTSGSASNRSYRGRIAHVRLWINRVLDQTTIQELSEDPYRAWEDSIFYFLVPNLSLPRTVQSLQMRGNIRGLADQDIQLRANIRNVLAQSLDMRARISHTVFQSMQMRATIEVPQTDLDGILDSWTVSDQFDTFSRQFSAQATDVACLQVGNEIIIKAGYDAERNTLIKAHVDRITKLRVPDQKKFNVAGRDVGAKEIDTFRITKAWKSEPTKSMPTAHQIIREVCGFAGLTVGNLDFPNYDLYNSYIAIGKRVLDIVAELAEPWNLFTRVQYIPQVRDRTLSVVKVDFENVPSDGYVINRRQHSQQELTQEAYLDQPRLNEVQLIVIRGAAYTQKLCELFGMQTRTEYFRNVATVEVETSIAGQVTGPDETITQFNAATSKEVTTETTVVETVYCDKVLNRVETIYVDDELTARTTERFWYYEPGSIQSVIPADVDTFVVQSGSPSENALLYMAHTKREGLADRDGAIQFIEVFKQTTQYYYDEEQQVACEQTTTQEFDEDLGSWGITKQSSRTHSQLTGGSVRTTLQTFTFEDSKYKLTAADIQNVGGTRASINQPASRQNVRTTQAQAPQGEVDADGEPIDPGEGLYTWTYENPYIGQDVCDRLYELAQEEQEFQDTGAKWEFINFDGILNPNINVGRPVSIEREDGTFRDYWVESVQHSFNANFAGTSGTAKRITTEDMA